jgi:hypothetical protein
MTQRNPLITCSGCCVIKRLYPVHKNPAMPVEFALPLQPEELVENVGTEKYAVESNFDLDMGPDALIEVLEGT